LVGVFSRQLSLEVLQAFTRPPLQSGYERLWPGTGYFTHAVMKLSSLGGYGHRMWVSKCNFAKSRVGYGCGWGEWHHEVSVDGVSRTDVCYLNGCWAAVPGGGAETDIYYQPVTLDHGLVVTECYLLGLRRWGYGVWGGKSWIRPIISTSTKWDKDSVFRPDWWKLTARDYEKNTWYENKWNVDPPVYIPPGTTMYLGVELHSECDNGKVETHASWLEFRGWEATVTIEADKTSVHIGETVTFSGTVTVKGGGYQTNVRVLAVDPTGAEKTLGTARSDSEGHWQLEWTAEEPRGVWTVWAECEVSDPITIRSTPLEVGVETAPRMPPWLVALLVGAPMAVGTLAMIPWGKVFKRGERT